MKKKLLLAVLVLFLCCLIGCERTPPLPNPAAAMQSRLEKWQENWPVEVSVTFKIQCKP